jgi:translation initiation factor IF-1
VGVDPAVTGTGQDGKTPARAVTATVLELLPNASYRLELANREQVLAHFASAARLNFVRVRPGDRVEVEISPHDRTRGRIVKLLRKG